VYDNSFILRTLEKALHDFELDPHHTEFTILVPRWTDSTWWHLTRSFEIAETYEQGSTIFTAPVRGTYATESLQPAGSEGGDDRCIIQGTSWPVCVLRKTAHTATTVDDHVLFHMRMGHLGATASNEIIARTDINTGLQLDRNKVCKSSQCHICQTVNRDLQPQPVCVTLSPWTYTPLCSLTYMDQ